MKDSFNASTRWIWAPDAIMPPGDNWWMFRRTLTLPADCREARLRIAAAFHYLLYINGTLITRGPARSYDFRKAYRSDYLAAHLEQVARALAEGAKVRGYCRWSLLDNLEWDMGWGQRFGLIHVDYQTLKRTVKESGW